MASLTSLLKVSSGLESSMNSLENTNTIINYTDQIPLIDYGSFEKLIPLNDHNSKYTITKEDHGCNLFWAVWGNDKISVILKSVTFNELDDEKENYLMNETKNKDHNIIEQFVDELKLISNLNHHSNITKFYGLTKASESDEIFAVMQYATEGNLRQYLLHYNSVLSWNNRIKFSKEIADGLHFIHNRGISHQNLHPNNILIHDNHVIISDLGFSNLKCSAKNSPHFKEMVPFIEPVFLKNRSYELDKRSDIYSFGGIMWELANGRAPFELSGSNYHLIINLILNGERDNSIISGTPIPYVQLYRKCWDGEPNNRPTIEYIIERLKLIHSEVPETFTKSPIEIKFKLEHLRSLQLSQIKPKPTISPRVDSIGWRDLNDLSEYEIIEKDDIKEYSNLCQISKSAKSAKSRSISFEHVDTSRLFEKTRRLSFGNFRKSIPSSTGDSHQSSKIIHSMSIDEASDLCNNKYFNMRSNSSSSLFDNRQPEIIFLSRYCVAKNIVKAFEQLKKRGTNIFQREIYKSKSVFHNLIWNDDLFDIININSTKIAKHNHFRAALKWLIANNLDINSLDDFGWTALHEAIWKRKEPGVILALLEYNANPNIPDKLGATPLHQCLDLLRTTTKDDETKRIYIIIRMLLQNGADPNLTLPDTSLTISGSSFPNCLFAAVYLDLPLDIIELMIKRGADITSTTFRGLYLLDFTAKIINV
ncbi:7170_t:CDS:2 [Diversispora eburnea]|uniref:7170_t:CDS:1 n=1 Tax=Diversispora eburnea TaxID=1213867 RepID=A0A9N9FTY3_9GLOM|nr:7170_t:CDS:2 [Diversispora eburnea]